MTWLTRPRFFALILSLELLVVVVAQQSPEANFLPGDAGFYAAATHSMVFDRDLNLLNQCFPDALTPHDALPELGGEHGGEFGLSVRGELTLKQSPVMPLVAMPFYALLARPGLLLFNLVQMTVLLGLVAALVTGPVGRVTAILLYTTTPLWRFTHDFSPDVFLCALLMAGLGAANRRWPLVCGVCLGLAVGAKVYVLLLAAPVALVALGLARPWWQGTFLGLLGGAIGLAPAAIFNTHQYGAPWVTGYERQLLVVDDMLTVAGHTSRFTEPPLVGLQNIIFDRDLGLIPTAPIWALTGPAVVWLVARRRLGGWPAGALGVLGVNLALFSTYDGWHGGSELGNRYVFPALVCGFALIGKAVATRLVHRAKL